MTRVAARCQDFSPAPVSAPKSQVKAPADFEPSQKGLVVKPLPPPVVAMPQATPESPAIRRTVLQLPMDRRAQDTEAQNPQIQLNPPGPERLFRLENERDWKERMRQEALERYPSERITFPEEPVLTKEAYTQRVLPPLSEVVEPAYVTYKRLYFEQKNFERSGWDLGFITPVVSAGAFFWDVALLPYHMGTQPLRHYDTGAGQCMPGDPAPFLLYPPEFSLTGVMAEAGTIVALWAIFPGP